MTYYQNKQLQNAYKDFVKSQHCNYFVTANFNRNTTINGARKALKHWAAKIDRKLLGKNWAKIATDERLHFFACAEHINSNLHWHLLLKITDKNKRNSFEHVAAKYWREIVECGNMQIDFLETEKDNAKASSYLSKELWKSNNYNQFIISREFCAE